MMDQYSDFSHEGLQYTLPADQYTWHERLEDIFFVLSAPFIWTIKKLRKAPKRDLISVSREYFTKEHRHGLERANRLSIGCNISSIILVLLVPFLLFRLGDQVTGAVIEHAPVEYWLSLFVCATLAIILARTRILDVPFCYFSNRRRDLNMAKRIYHLIHIPAVTSLIVFYGRAHNKGVQKHLKRLLSQQSSP